VIEDQAIAQLRIPPHSVEAESSVLGGLLLEGSAWDRVGDFLADSDFYRHEHKLIFSSIRDLARGGKPVDAITVYEHLESSGKAEEAGGLPYLNSLAQFVMSAANIQRYAEIVREHSLRRRLVSAADEIASSAFSPNGQTIDSVVDAAQQKLLALSISSSSGDDWTSAYEGMVTHSELLERRNSGELEAWATGLSDLDEYLEGGFRPGELVIVGARPSMGKTALGLSIGVHMARERVVGFLSMEMSKQEVNDRLTAMLGHVSMSSVKRPRKGDGLQWGSVLEGVERAKELRLHISDQGGLNINQVRTKARNAKRLFGLQVLVVDYIGLMSGLDQRQNRNAQLGEISRGLKNLARELELAVVCLAQLNRKAEERSEQMPQMSDLRDSGEIEQDADVILFIKRPIMANPELGDEWKNYAKLAVAKNRQGRCGHLDLAYIGEQTRFTSWGGPAPAKQQPASRKYRGGGL
jgi:replicative DNA helicase